MIPYKTLIFVLLPLLFFNANTSAQDIISDCQVKGSVFLRSTETGKILNTNEIPASGESVEIVVEISSSCAINVLYGPYELYDSPEYTDDLHYVFIYHNFNHYIEDVVEYLRHEIIDDSVFFYFKVNQNKGNIFRNILIAEVFDTEILFEEIFIQKSNIPYSSSSLYLPSSENYILACTPQEPITTVNELRNLCAAKKRATVQYFDDLGHPKQKIDIAQSPQGNDLVQPYIYDTFGREQKRYLPYVYELKSNNGHITGANTNTVVSLVKNFYRKDNDLITNSAYPYSETEFDGSPLYRIKETASPGANWQLTTSEVTNGGHTIKIEYRTNTDNEVIRFATEKGEIKANGFYLANELQKTISKDENWTIQSNSSLNKLNTMEEYKNRLGQTVLKRTYTKDKDNMVVAVDTYYLYDGFGLLNHVLPPEAVNKLDQLNTGDHSTFKVITSNKKIYGREENIDTYLIAKGSSLTIGTGFTFTASAGKSLTLKSGHVSTELLYSYKYDGRKRMIEKKIPGADPIYIVYDNRDRLVATQDGEMRQKGQWLFTKYDALNRPVATGIYRRNITRDLLQQEVTAYTGIMYESRGSARHGYDNASWPQTSANHDYLTVTYYDNYSFSGAESFRADPYHNVSGETANFATVKGQVTGSKTQILDGNEFTISAQWTMSTNYYDDRYRAIQSISDLYPTNGTNKVVFSSNYDFVGKVENTKQVQTFEGTVKTIEERFEYDHAGRLLETWHSIDGATEVLLAKNEYNELGELVKKNLGGSSDANCAQAIDYKYNIRGWLTQLNDPDVTGDTKRKFGMKLRYNDPVSGLSNPAQYNGNISAIEWRTPGDNATGSPSLKQAYGFGYDATNRLTAADYGEGSSFTGNANAFNVSGIQYDLNGNITGLDREMAIETSGATFTAKQIDNLTYTYAGNQLLSVSDAANGTYKDKNNVLAKDYGFKDGASSAVEYAYDLNGNMTRDDNKGLADVEYNHLNLPRTLTGTDNKTISYIYGANGQKLAKTANDVTTYYAGNMVYEENSLQYILHGEGKYDLTSGSGQYQFDIKDHLGNVRMVVDLSGNELQQSAYYPFGMAFQKGGNANNKYLYNGKELQEEEIGNGNLDCYDYGARFYDPAIGRWHVIDNKAEKYYPNSPYTYALNNPLRFVDPDGNEIVDATGNTMFTSSGGWNNNATQGAKEIAAAMMKTKTGRAQWNNMVNSNRKITLNLDPGSHDDFPNATGSTKLPLVQSRSTGIIRMKEGGIIKVTIYKGKIATTLENGKKNKGLTLEEAIGAAASHEAFHASNEENIEKQIEYADEQTQENWHAKEDKAYEVGSKVREESRNAPKKIDNKKQYAIDTKTLR